MSGGGPGAAAILTEAGISFELRRHADLGGPVRAPTDVARLLGYDIGRITKTLLVVDQRLRDRCALAVVPVTARTDFVAVGRSQGWARAEMARPEELAGLLAQPPKGVSPVVPAPIPVVVDQSLVAHPTVLIGSGDVGVEIEIEPAALIGATGATLGWLTAK
ncbi:MAG TPA: YbaK/EbsC family protein [Acidimicrobiales bacterium]|jgi:Cys-tRNA(Pro)/Cys-tRNA(Cys) deacylase